MDEHAEKSVIANGTRCTGTVTSDCPVSVSGAVEGELTAPVLVVTESGRVNGTVRVKEIQSSGEISGDIDADTMQLSGTVRDNTSIRVKSLEVKLSSGDADKLQVVFGKATVEAGPEPSFEDDAPEAGELSESD